MHVLRLHRGLALATLLPAVAAAQAIQPRVSFPDPGLDDAAAYPGYVTRLYQDANRNTVQAILNSAEGRVITLFANAENETIAWSVLSPEGTPVQLRWGSPSARRARTGRTNTFIYDISAQGSHVELGHFLLGTTRQERDVLYWRKHREPVRTPPFVLEELQQFVQTLATLDPDTRARHLAATNAPSLPALEARLRPTVTVTPQPTRWTARIVQPSLDGRDTLFVELAVDPRRVEAARDGHALTLRARAGREIPIRVTLGTTGRPLAPISREQIFTPAFLAFVERTAREARDSAQRAEARRMARQVTGVELLASREKMFAGLWTYATYFGRDQMMTALMMRPIWQPAATELVIGSVLRNLAPSGAVSHEEALGGQAVRETLHEYVQLVRQARTAPDPAATLRRAEALLREQRRVRQAYLMVDDKLQLPVLVAQWLADPRVDAARARAFLQATDAGESRISRLVRALDYVARMTAPYAAAPEPRHLIAFEETAPGVYGARSWRDSRVGYANGRYAMDVNAIWAPHALESIRVILARLAAAGYGTAALARAHPAQLGEGTPLGRYLRDSSALASAIRTWWTAPRHFEVALTPAEVQARLAARLAAMPDAERAVWAPVVQAMPRDSLRFLAIALDAAFTPIGVASTDPSLRLFLGDGSLATAETRASRRATVLRDARLMAQPFPVGLLVPGVGPAVANDAYATDPHVWAEFEADRYHGPRVVWGREVNLFVMGAAARLLDQDAADDPAYRAELRRAIEAVQGAAAASGFHSELWSYEVRDGRVRPTRYGAAADIQLWSTTDLAVHYILASLRAH